MTLTTGCSDKGENDIKEDTSYRCCNREVYIIEDDKIPILHGEVERVDASHTIIILTIIIVSIISPSSGIGVDVDSRREPIS